MGIDQKNNERLTPRSPHFQKTETLSRVRRNKPLSERPEYPVTATSSILRQAN